MNFINTYRRNNLQYRSGMILLVVMAVLAFFAVLGMTFILMTGKNRDSAETAQLAAQNSKTTGNSPQELLEEGIMQVLVGPPKDGTTQSKNSALYECDLIGDMYGTVDANNLDVVTASFSGNTMTPANADYAGRVVTIAEGPYKGQSTIILNSRGAIIPFASGIGVSEAVPQVRCVINKKRAYQGNEANYDVADLNETTKSNDFMSLRHSGGDNNITVGRVVVPSYYRGGVRPGLNDNTELGGTGVYPDLSNGFTRAASKNASPWDVDNDGDGDNDSVWMNLGLPPRPMPDGTLVVPMYAILVEDLDGRINVNAHGFDNTSTTTTATATYSSMGSTTTPVKLINEETLDSTTMLNGQGFGPADVNMQPLLGDTITGNIVTQRCTGNNNRSDLFTYRFPEWTSLKEADFSAVAGSYKNFRAPLDFWGVMAGAIDQNGMFIWEKRGEVGNYKSSSYERDLGTAQPRGSRAVAKDKIFSAEELEGVLRVYDDDSQKLESRLINIVKTSTDIDSIRNLITTESWDMPYCDVSCLGTLTDLPEEIQAGFKLDINRPLTSYEDNADVADAERTQLAKDLYLLITRLGITDKKAAAQWAVNAVDFRDADSVCTHLSIDGNDVWGCERPELLITETFAFHARMTEDSELGGWRSDQSDKCARPSGASAVAYIDAEWYDKADCPNTDSPSEEDVQAFCSKYAIPFSRSNMGPIIDLMNRVRNSNSDGKADMDQVFKPESGLFIELYNPWLSANNQEAAPSGEYTNGGVTLGSSGGKMVDSAWRIAVAGGKAVNATGSSWAEDLREKKYTINRVLYFGASTPESGEFTYKANTSVCVKPGQCAVIGPTGNTYLARNEDSGAGARPITITPGSTTVKFDNASYTNVCAIGVPDCGKARFSVTDIGTYTDPVDNSGRLTTPRDMPYDADDANRWTNLDGIGHGLGEDFEQACYRVVYLQRLANPYKAYNATTNPYITFDQMPVDLFSYNGRQNKFADYKSGLAARQKATEADELAYKHADVFIKSRQRGETQAFAGSTCAKFWTAEKLPGQTNKTASSKLSLSTQGSGRGAVIAAVKTNFYHSINRFEPRFYNLVSTTVSGTTTPANLPSYQSVAPYYFPNRPFSSVLELMLVPQVSAYQLTSSANAIDDPTSAELAPGSLPKYLCPTDAPHIDFLTETGSKIFNYVRIQSPFADTPMNVNTYYVNGNNETVHTTAAPEGYRWTFREPGKVNINSITHPAVWAGLLGVNSQDKLSTISGLTSTDMFSEYWGKVFSENPGTRPRTFGASDANYIAANYLIFRMNNTAKESQSSARNVYFQTQLMQRLSNLTTTRSNVFAVWITVGFFEYNGAGGGGNGVSQFKVGKEYGLDNGSRQRYRAFYIIDRTRPVGYSPGSRMNADKTIILRRYLP